MTNEIKEILNEYVQGLLRIIGKDLDKIILYGSYARGDQDKNGEISDIDIMILVKSNELKDIERKVLDYSYELDLKYDILLSPIIENTDEFKKRVQYIPFYKNVNKEGILLKG